MNKIREWFKRELIPLVVILAALFCGAAIFSAYVAVVNLTAGRIALDTGVKFQTMEGFGMSAALSCRRAIS